MKLNLLCFTVCCEVNHEFHDEIYTKEALYKNLVKGAPSFILTVSRPKECSSRIRSQQHYVSVRFATSLETVRFNHETHQVKEYNTCDHSISKKPRNPASTVRSSEINLIHQSTVSISFYSNSNTTEFLDFSCVELNGYFQSTPSEWVDKVYCESDVRKNVKEWDRH